MKVTVEWVQEGHEWGHEMQYGPFKDWKVVGTNNYDEQISLEIAKKPEFPGYQIGEVVPYLQKLNQKDGGLGQAGKYAKFTDDEGRVWYKAKHAKNDEADLPPVAERADAPAGQAAPPPAAASSAGPPPPPPGKGYKPAAPEPDPIAAKPAPKGNSHTPAPPKPAGRNGLPTRTQYRQMLIEEKFASYGQIHLTAVKYGYKVPVEQPSEITAEMMMDWAGPTGTSTQIAYERGLCVDDPAHEVDGGVASDVAEDDSEIPF